MGRITLFFARLVGKDRRTHHEPVAMERRQRRPGFRDSHKLVENALQNLEKTVSLKHDDFVKYAANDKQTQVQFVTFQDICTYTLRQGDFRICKHPRHEAANTGIATCNEDLCPVLKGAA